MALNQRLEAAGVPNPRADWYEHGYRMGVGWKCEEGEHAVRVASIPSTASAYDVNALPGDLPEIVLGLYQDWLKRRQAKK